jgi:spermidine synthase/MFS family permease
MRRSGALVLHAVFFLSGASALLYQTAWHRLLGLFSGADSLSSAVVVGAFLLGIGLGSLIAGLVVDRLDRKGALLAFAACELAITAYAAFTPWLFHDVLFGRYVTLAESRLLTFALAFAGLALPTFMMGVSLPLLSRAVVTDVERAAVDVGHLYFVNTLGAGAGALFAGWWLIGHVGYDVAIRIGACVNVVVGLGALWASRGEIRSRQARRSVPAATRLDRHVAKWCLLVFASGFIAVSLQIVWYRIVGVLLQGNAYAFSSVLGLLLIADAIGMAWGVRLVPRLANPGPTFLKIQAWVSVSALIGVWLLHAAFGHAEFASHFIDHDPLEATPGDLAALIGATLLLVVPSSILIGFTFPLAQRAVQDNPDLIGRRVGWIQVSNIAGNSAGSLGAGLLLLHWFGTAGTLRLVGVVGLVFLLPLSRGSRRPTIAAAALVVLVVLLPDNRDFWSRLHRVGAQETSFQAEDRTGTVLLRVKNDGTSRLFIQGHAQSGIPFWAPHTFLGAIGPLVHPAPKDVLVVGVGSGGTPFAAGLNPKTERVRAVEIVEPVYTTLRRFAHESRGEPIRPVVGDLRYDWAVGDGRRDLFVGQGRYDIVQADAILPKTSHSGLLYSAEFFREVRAHLKPGGLAVQWAPTDRVVRTFRSVFPYVVEFHPALLGSERPIVVDRAAILAAYDASPIQDRLKAAAIDTVEIRRWFERARLTYFEMATAQIDINTDLFPRDEYYLNR